MSEVSKGFNESIETLGFINGFQTTKHIYTQMKITYKQKDLRSRVKRPP